mmetsp:Transcript_6743/g.14434  ORF Transcript_6743/g.14434 Transcript_6743/m.14434 type:complete len:83 (+) Transcript_6743:149-397(+)|eukprot:scaffold18285_cov35-Tisochrysis_lutea.AAC.2
MHMRLFSKRSVACAPNPAPIAIAPARIATPMAIVRVEVHSGGIQRVCCSISTGAASARAAGQYCPRKFAAMHVANPVRASSP